MSNNFELVAIDEFLIKNNKPLFWELAINVTGLRFSCAFHMLRNLFSTKNPGKVTYEDLTPQQQETLHKVIGTHRMQGTRINSNRKRITDEQSSIVNAILFGSVLKVQVKKDLISLKKEKCRIGYRHSVGLKVHGQRTRTTGKASKLNLSKGSKVVKTAKSTKKQ